MDEETHVPAKPSKVPSWVTLGFILGALFVWALPRRAAEVPPPRPVVEAPAAKPVKSADAPRIETIEAVFASWGGYAVWSNDTTQVALWDLETKSYSDCYEVIRVGENFYFRSIPELTHPILTHGIGSDSPIEFTETERQRAEWLSEVGKENIKALSATVNPPPEPAPKPKS
jgi:hypothetical protein